MLLALTLAIAAPIAVDYSEVGPLDVVDLAPAGEVQGPEAALAEANALAPRICAETLVRAAAVDPTHPLVPRLLFNAARCADGAKLVGVAMHLRERILTEFPTSEPFAATLLALAQTHQAMASFGKSALLYERYTNLFMRRPEAHTALTEAIALRAGFGQPERALGLVQIYENRYGRKDPKGAAALVFATRSLVDTPRERVAEAERYLLHYDTKGGLHRRLVVYAELGETLWTGACRDPADDGSCTRLVDVTPACEGLPRLERRPSARATAQARQGRAWLDRGLKLRARIGDEAPDPTVAEDYRQAIGALLFYRVDRDFEAFIAGEVRRPLHRAQQLAEAYAAVKQSRSPRWAHAANYRTAVAFLHAAQLLAESEDDCEAANSAMTYAADRFRYCLRLAVETRVFTSEARRCEAAMQQIAPDEFPALHELVGTAEHDEVRMESVGVVTDWAEVEPYYTPRR